MSLADPKTRSVRSRAKALALVLVTSGALVGGPTQSATFPWGFRVGWSGARLGGDFGKIIGPDIRSDVTASIFARFGLGAALGFQPELGWVTKGGAGDVGPPSQDFFHLEHRVNYLEVPLLVRYEIPTRGAFGSYVLLGPAPAFRMGEVDTEESFIGKTAGVRPAKSSAQIFEDLGTGTWFRAESFDLGIVGGVGAGFGRGNVRLGIEARYNYGLLDVHPSEHADLRNEVFEVTTAVEFR